MLHRLPVTIANPGNLTSEPWKGVGWHPKGPSMDRGSSPGLVTGMTMALKVLLVLSCLAGATGFTTLHHMPLGMQGVPLRGASLSARSHFAPFAPSHHLRSIRFLQGSLRSRPEHCTVYSSSSTRSMRPSAPSV